MNNTNRLSNAAWVAGRLGGFRTLGGIVVVTAVLLGGCSTMAGVGQDVQKGGEAIERGANSNR